MRFQGCGSGPRAAVLPTPVEFDWLEVSGPRVVDVTTAISASESAGGSVFPRVAARRRIPAQAVALKKYRCGIEPFSSTCDNEHTAASLGHSEILGIENPPRD